MRSLQEIRLQQVAAILLPLLVIHVSNSSSQHHNRLLFVIILQVNLPLHRLTILVVVANKRLLKTIRVIRQHKRLHLAITVRAVVVVSSVMKRRGI
jgi:hypothetical protein